MWRSLSYLHTGKAYLALNQASEAKAILEMLLKVYPDEPTSIFALEDLENARIQAGDSQGASEMRAKITGIASAENVDAILSKLADADLADGPFSRRQAERILGKSPKPKAAEVAQLGKVAEEVLGYIKENWMMTPSSYRRRPTGK